MRGLFLNDYILRRNRSIAKEARPAASAFVLKKSFTNWRTFCFPSWRFGRKGFIKGCCPIGNPASESQWNNDHRATDFDFTLRALGRRFWLPNLIDQTVAGLMR